MTTPTSGRSHRIVVHLPMHTELWYSAQIPLVGWRFPHRGEAYEVLSCRMDGSGYIIEVRKIDRRSLDDGPIGLEPKV